MVKQGVIQSTISDTKLTFNVWSDASGQRCLFAFVRMPMASLSLGLYFICQEEGGCMMDTALTFDRRRLYLRLDMGQDERKSGHRSRM